MYLKEKNGDLGNIIICKWDKRMLDKKHILKLKFNTTIKNIHETIGITRTNVHKRMIKFFTLHDVKQT